MGKMKLIPPFFSIVIISEHRDILQKKVSSWDFSPLNLSHDDLVHCSVIIISQVFLSNEVTEFSQGNNSIT